tara:strand:- start:4843 stop:5574 length:732 start_codon:yes stop_codon:yes gene_type:complete
MEKENPYEVERHLLKIFRKKFIQRSGSEYFTVNCSEEELIDLFYENSKQKSIIIDSVMDHMVLQIENAHLMNYKSSNNNKLQTLNNEEDKKYVILTFLNDNYMRISPNEDKSTWINIFILHEKFLEKINIYIDIKKFTEIIKMIENITCYPIDKTYIINIIERNIKNWIYNKYTITDIIEDKTQWITVEDLYNNFISDNENYPLVKKDFLIKIKELGIIKTGDGVIKKPKNMKHSYINILERN